MRKFLSFLVWVICGLSGIYCLFCILAYSNTYDDSKMITYAVFGGVLLLISGIFRRVFGIRKVVVEQKGLWPAIASRINCKRFYFSVPFYTVISVMMFFFGRQAEGDLLKFFILLPVAFLLYLFIRHSCPRCGVSLKHDRDSYNDKVELKFYDDEAIKSKEKTSHFHCPRCGRKITMTKMEVVKIYKYKDL